MENTGLTRKSFVAHRGYQASYPENTRLSLLSAIQVGARFIELDVQFSRDKHPIIYHDTDLQRISGIAAKVCELSREQLLSIPAYEPNRLGDQFYNEKIAPLEALTTILQDHPSVTAFVELKQESIGHCSRTHIIKSVREILHPVAQQTVIMSFDYQLAGYAREAGWPWVGVVLKNWHDLTDKLVVEIQPDYIFVNHLIIPTERDLHNHPALANSKLVAYEVADFALAQSLFKRGVDMHETFDIKQLLEAL
jgi:glycerophosphoryl diester phosphodiesterase